MQNGRTYLTVAFPNRKIDIFGLKANLKAKIVAAKANESVVQATKHVQSHFEE